MIKDSHQPSFNWIEIWSHAIRIVWCIRILIFGRLWLIHWSHVLCESKWRTNESSTLIRMIQITHKGWKFYSSWFIDDSVNMFVFIRLSIILAFGKGFFIEWQNRYEESIRQKDKIFSNLKGKENTLVSCFVIVLMIVELYHNWSSKNILEQLYD